MPKLPPNVAQALTDATRALEKKKKDEVKKKKEEALVKKVGRKLRQIFYGPKYHAATTKPKVKPTVRTKAVVEKGLKPAGLTQKEINRLRSKR